MSDHYPKALMHAPTLHTAALVDELSRIKVVILPEHLDLAMRQIEDGLSPEARAAGGARVIVASWVMRVRLGIDRLETTIPTVLLELAHFVPGRKNRNGPIPPTYDPPTLTRDEQLERDIVLAHIARERGRLS